MATLISKVENFLQAGMLCIGICTVLTSCTTNTTISTSPLLERMHVPQHKPLPELQNRQKTSAGSRPDQLASADCPCNWHDGLASKLSSSFPTVCAPACGQLLPTQSSGSPSLVPSTIQRLLRDSSGRGLTNNTVPPPCRDSHHRPQQNNKSEPEHRYSVAERFLPGSPETQLEPNQRTSSMKPASSGDLCSPFHPTLPNTGSTANDVASNKMRIGASHVNNSEVQRISDVVTYPRQDSTALADERKSMNVSASNRIVQACAMVQRHEMTFIDLPVAAMWSPPYGIKLSLKVSPRTTAHTVQRFHVGGWQVAVLFGTFMLLVMLGMCACRRRNDHPAAVRTGEEDSDTAKVCYSSDGHKSYFQSIDSELSSDCHMGRRPSQFELSMQPVRVSTQDGDARRRSADPEQHITGNSPGGQAPQPPPSAMPCLVKRELDMRDSAPVMCSTTSPRQRNPLRKYPSFPFDGSTHRFWADARAGGPSSDDTVDLDEDNVLLAMQERRRESSIARHHLISSGSSSIEDSGVSSDATSPTPSGWMHHHRGGRDKQAAYARHADHWPEPLLEDVTSADGSLRGFRAGAGPKQQQQQRGEHQQHYSVLQRYQQPKRQHQRHRDLENHASHNSSFGSGGPADISSDDYGYGARRRANTDAGSLTSATGAHRRPHASRFAASRQQGQIGGGGKAGMEEVSNGAAGSMATASKYGGQKESRTTSISNSIKHRFSRKKVSPKSAQQQQQQAKRDATHNRSDASTQFTEFDLLARRSPGEELDDGRLPPAPPNTLTINPSGSNWENVSTSSGRLLKTESPSGASDSSRCTIDTDMFRASFSAVSDTGDDDANEDDCFPSQEDLRVSMPCAARRVLPRQRCATSPQLNLSIFTRRGSQERPDVLSLGRISRHARSCAASAQATSEESDAMTSVEESGLSSPGEMCTALGGGERRGVAMAATSIGPMSMLQEMTAATAVYKGRERSHTHSAGSSVGSPRYDSVRRPSSNESNAVEMESLTTSMTSSTYQRIAASDWERHTSVPSHDSVSCLGMSEQDDGVGSAATHHASQGGSTDTEDELRKHHHFHHQQQQHYQHRMRHCSTVEVSLDSLEPVPSTLSQSPTSTLERSRWRCAAEQAIHRSAESSMSYGSDTVIFPHPNIYMSIKKLAAARTYMLGGGSHRAPVAMTPPACLEEVSPLASSLQDLTMKERPPSVTSAAYISLDFTDSLDSAKSGVMLPEIQYSDLCHQRPPPGQASGSASPARGSPLSSLSYRSRAQSMDSQFARSSRGLPQAPVHTNFKEQQLAENSTYLPRTFASRTSFESPLHTRKFPSGISHSSNISLQNRTNSNNSISNKNPNPNNNPTASHSNATAGKQSHKTARRSNTSFPECDFHLKPDLAQKTATSSTTPIPIMNCSRRRSVEFVLDDVPHASSNDALTRKAPSVGSRESAAAMSSNFSWTCQSFGDIASLTSSSGGGGRRPVLSSESTVHDSTASLGLSEPPPVQHATHGVNDLPHHHHQHRGVGGSVGALTGSIIPSAYSLTPSSGGGNSMPNLRKSPSIQSALVVSSEKKHFLGNIRRTFNFSELSSSSLPKESSHGGGLGVSSDRLDTAAEEAIYERVPQNMRRHTLTAALPKHLRNKARSRRGMEPSSSFHKNSSSRDDTATGKTAVERSTSMGRISVARFSEAMRSRSENNLLDDSNDEPCDAERQRRQSRSQQHLQKTLSANERVYEDCRTVLSSASSITGGGGGGGGGAEFSSLLSRSLSKRTRPEGSTPVTAKPSIRTLSPPPLPPAFSDDAAHSPPDSNYEWPINFCLPALTDSAVELAAPVSKQDSVGHARPVATETIQERRRSVGSCMTSPGGFESLVIDSCSSVGRNSIPDIAESPKQERQNSSPCSSPVLVQRSLPANYVDSRSLAFLTPAFVDEAYSPPCPGLITWQKMQQTGGMPQASGPTSPQASPPAATIRSPITSRQSSPIGAPTQTSTLQKENSSGRKRLMSDEDHQCNNTLTDSSGYEAPHALLLGKKDMKKSSSSVPYAASILSSTLASPLPDVSVSSSSELIELLHSKFKLYDLPSGACISSAPPTPVATTTSAAGAGAGSQCLDVNEPPYDNESIYSTPSMPSTPRSSGTAGGGGYKKRATIAHTVSAMPSFHGRTRRSYPNEGGAAHSFSEFGSGVTAELHKQHQLILSPKANGADDDLVFGISPSPGGTANAGQSRRSSMGHFPLLAFPPSKGTVTDAANALYDVIGVKAGGGGNDGGGHAADNQNVPRGGGGGGGNGGRGVDVYARVPDLSSQQQLTGTQSIGSNSFPDLRFNSHLITGGIVNASYEFYQEHDEDDLYDEDEFDEYLYNNAAEEIQNGEQDNASLGSLENPGMLPSDPVYASSDTHQSSAVSLTGQRSVPLDYCFADCNLSGMHVAGITPSTSAQSVAFYSVLEKTSDTTTSVQTMDAGSFPGVRRDQQQAWDASSFPGVQRDRQQAWDANSFPGVYRDQQQAWDASSFPRVQRDQPAHPLPFEDMDGGMNSLLEKYSSTDDLSTMLHHPDSYGSNVRPLRSADLYASVGSTR